MDTAQINKINWFPGHMKKATDEIKKKLSIIDLIIEVVDARCINSSSNFDLTNLIENKPIIRIALKSDLSLISEQYTNELIVTNTKNKNNRKKIIDVFYSIFESKINKYKSKGLVNPRFLIMIIGLPNVGKSSLINFLKSKNNLIVRNQPGVTKNQRLVSINENFDLIDTPGILLKNIDNYEIAYKLSLINTIKKEVLPLDKVVKFGFDYLNTHFYQELKEFYKIEDFSDFENFQILVAKRLNYITKNAEIDLKRLEDKLFNDFLECKISKVNYDF